MSETSGIDAKKLQESLLDARIEEIKPSCGEASIQSANPTQEEMDEREQEREERAAAIVNSMELVVRGAMLRCNCGSHCRRLNLPISHSSHFEKRPYMSEDDCVSGNKENCENATINKEINISYFGICQKGKSKGSNIVLEADVPRDVFGNPLPQEKSSKPKWKQETNHVSGHACMPDVTTKWFCPDERSTVDSTKFITTGSFLVCKYGGIIEVLQSGQKMQDNIDTRLEQEE